MKSKDHRTGVWFWLRVLFWAANSMVFACVLLRFGGGYLFEEWIFTAVVFWLALRSAWTSWGIWKGR